MSPDLNAHLTHEMRANDDRELLTFVLELLDVGTCFDVIGGDLRIRTTERGAEKLVGLI